MLASKDQERIASVCMSNIDNIVSSLPAWSMINMANAFFCSFRNWMRFRKKTIRCSSRFLNGTMTAIRHLGLQSFGDQWPPGCTARWRASAVGFDSGFVVTLNATPVNREIIFVYIGNINFHGISCHLIERNVIWICQSLLCAGTIELIDDQSCLWAHYWHWQILANFWWNPPLFAGPYLSL